MPSHHPASNTNAVEDKSLNMIFCYVHGECFYFWT
jgi:hypothetical protein